MELTKLLCLSNELPEIIKVIPMSQLNVLLMAKYESSGEAEIKESRRSSIQHKPNPCYIDDASITSSLW